MIHATGLFIGGIGLPHSGDMFRVVENEEGELFMRNENTGEVYGIAMKTINEGGIDADELYDKVEEKYKTASGEKRKCYKEVLGMICDAELMPFFGLVKAEE